MRFFECYAIKVDFDYTNPTIDIHNMFIPTTMTVELEDSNRMNADELQTQLGRAIHESFKTIVNELRIKKIDFEYMEIKHHICGAGCRDEKHKKRPR